MRAAHLQVQVLLPLMCRPQRRPGAALLPLAVLSAAVLAAMVLPLVLDAVPAFLAVALAAALAGAARLAHELRANGVRLWRPEPDVKAMPVPVTAAIASRQPAAITAGRPVVLEGFVLSQGREASHDRSRRA